MKPSIRSTLLTQAFEKCRLVAYWDGTYKDVARIQRRYTLGWGHTLNVVEGQTCTQDSANEWLQLDQEDAAVRMTRHLSRTVSQWEDLNPTTVSGIAAQLQFDALTDFVYNIGIGQFQTSRLAKLVSGVLPTTPQLIAAEFLKWNILDGEPSNGLLRRRLAERALFLGDFRLDGALKTEKCDFPDAVWF